jgi:ADP-ribose pyrophosphatase YjhB (NUDIX family)
VSERILCPHCGRATGRFDQPRLTVDAVVFGAHGGVLLIERKHEPPGWALPGGFVDPGETLEEAVTRELAEETGLRALDVAQFHTYSEPHRDPRHHTVSTIFLVRAEGELRAGDDAVRAEFFPLGDLPFPIAFDHERILEDVARYQDEIEDPTEGS